MKLKNVTVHKYKCIESDQNFNVEDDITILVGMNESGKTSILEALAKTNYFVDDLKFKFNKTHDYPRREKKKVDKAKVDPVAITCTYEISDEVSEAIDNDLGTGVFTQKTFNVSRKFSNSQTWETFNVDYSLFIKNKTKILDISSQTLNQKLEQVYSIEGLDEVIKEYKEEQYTKGLKSLKIYYENEWGWNSSPIGEYIARKYLKPALPKFLYYDEYYTLPSRISIENLQAESLEEEELKTAKALLELADINLDELINADDFEDYKAELEATEATITDELFKYWSTNKNLNIEFDIDKKEKEDEYGNNQIVEHILDIRVKNERTRVSLPLKNRSKGFNWFFSFLVWFKKIQEDTSSNYILLLDEPGLNLHASAQNDLLNFIEDLSANYQIIYTSHSPFMISPDKLERVRTIVESNQGAIVSDSIQEKDPNTLFPLQAALGYDIAQNLFISKNNLLVEGVSDLIYLEVMSSVLEESGRDGLKNDISIVPTGGLDKVATFISLLRGSKLNIVCLLDTFKDGKGKARIDNMIQQKIIHSKNIRFFHEFLTGYDYADIEDLFHKEDYLKLFNSAFENYGDVSIKDLNEKINPILIQLCNFLKIETFNHYRPALQLTKNKNEISSFDKVTLSNFEKIFIEINKLFD